MKENRFFLLFVMLPLLIDSPLNAMNSLRAWFGGQPNQRDVLAFDERIYNDVINDCPLDDTYHEDKRVFLSAVEDMVSIAVNHEGIGNFDDKYRIALQKAAAIFQKNPHDVRNAEQDPWFKNPTRYVIELQKLLRIFDLKKDCTIFERLASLEASVDTYTKGFCPSGDFNDFPGSAVFCRSLISELSHATEIVLNSDLTCKNDVYNRIKFLQGFLYACGLKEAAKEQYKWDSNIKRLYVEECLKNIESLLAPGVEKFNGALQLIKDAQKELADSIGEEQENIMQDFDTRALALLWNDDRDDRENFYRINLEDAKNSGSAQAMIDIAHFLENEETHFKRNHYFPSIKSALSIIKESCVLDATRIDLSNKEKLLVNLLNRAKSKIRILNPENEILYCLNRRKQTDESDLVVSPAVLNDAVLNFHAVIDDYRKRNDYPQIKRVVEGFSRRLEKRLRTSFDVDIVID